LSWILSPFLNQRMLTFCILMCCPPYRCLTVTHSTAYTGMMDYMIVSEKKEINNTVGMVFISIQFNHLLTSYIRSRKSRASYRTTTILYASGGDPDSYVLGLLDPDPGSFSIKQK
jgi:hypothetical protein